MCTYHKNLAAFHHHWWIPTHLVAQRTSIEYKKFCVISTNGFCSIVADGILGL
jgi:hypothetical protein